jgi:hypothetical protein
MSESRGPQNLFGVGQSQSLKVPSGINRNFRFAEFKLPVKTEFRLGPPAIGSPGDNTPRNTQSRTLLPFVLLIHNNFFQEEGHQFKQTSNPLLLFRNKLKKCIGSISAYLNILLSLSQCTD